jgi:hypothetical protein
MQKVLKDEPIENFEGAVISRPSAPAGETTTPATTLPEAAPPPDPAVQAPPEVITPL